MRVLSFRFAVIAACLVLFCSPGLAQEESGHRAAADELLELMNYEHIIIHSALTMVDAQLRSMPQMESTRDIIETFIRETLAWEIVKPLLTDLYVEMYSESELRDVIAFYRTPSGERMLAVQAEIMTRASAIGENLMTARQHVLERRLHERLLELDEGDRHP